MLIKTGTTSRRLVNYRKYSVNDQLHRVRYQNTENVTNF